MDSIEIDKDLLGALIDAAKRGTDSSVLYDEETGRSYTWDDLEAMTA